MDALGGTGAVCSAAFFAYSFVLSRQVSKRLAPLLKERLRSTGDR
jgi:hypothetical protein